MWQASIQLKLKIGNVNAYILYYNTKINKSKWGQISDVNPVYTHRYVETVDSYIGQYPFRWISWWSRILIHTHPHKQIQSNVKCWLAVNVNEVL